jgi:hypothetical protein
MAVSSYFLQPKWGERLFGKSAVELEGAKIKKGMGVRDLEQG